MHFGLALQRAYYLPLNMVLFLAIACELHLWTFRALRLIFYFILAAAKFYYRSFFRKRQMRLILFCLKVFFLRGLAYCGVVKEDFCSPARQVSFTF